MFDAKRCLVLAAHADDETIGCGGLIAALSDGGCDVTIAVATDGTSAQYAGDDMARKRRSQQLHDAAGILGVSNIFQGTFPDMRLDTIEHIALNRWVEAIVAETQPQLVLTHGPSDVNRDHVAIFHTAMVVSRPTPGQPIKTVMSYYVSSATEWGQFAGQSFQPNVFRDIASFLPKKLDAFSCYEDELRDFPHPRSRKALEIAAAYFGSICGMEAAEAFQLHRHTA